MTRLVWLVCVMTLVGVGCDRLQTPTTAQCELAVTNLVSKQMGSALDAEFPTKGDDSIGAVAGNLLKGMGQELLATVAVDDQMIAWCEVHMTLHDANCLRLAQSTEEAVACGYTFDGKAGLKEL